MLRDHERWYITQRSKRDAEKKKIQAQGTRKHIMSQEGTHCMAKDKRTGVDRKERKRDTVREGDREREIAHIIDIETQRRRLDILIDQQEKTEKMRERESTARLGARHRTRPAGGAIAAR